LQKSEGRISTHAGIGKKGAAAQIEREREKTIEVLIGENMMGSKGEGEGCVGKARKKIRLRPNTCLAKEIKGCTWRVGEGAPLFKKEKKNVRLQSGREGAISLLGTAGN